MQERPPFHYHYYNSQAYLQAILHRSCGLSKIKQPLCPPELRVCLPYTAYHNIQRKCHVNNIVHVSICSVPFCRHGALPPNDNERNRGHKQTCRTYDCQKQSSHTDSTLGALLPSVDMVLFPSNVHQSNRGHKQPGRTDYIHAKHKAIMTAHIYIAPTTTRVVADVHLALSASGRGNFTGSNCLDKRHMQQLHTHLQQSYSTNKG